jgi:hypothetical protein
MRQAKNVLWLDILKENKKYFLKTLKEKQIKPVT